MCPRKVTASGGMVSTQNTRNQDVFFVTVDPPLQRQLSWKPLSAGLMMRGTARFPLRVSLTLDSLAGRL